MAFGLRFRSGWRRLSFADSVAICFGDLQSFNGRITHQTLEAVPIPEEYSPPQVLVDTDKYLEMNRRRILDVALSACAVFNPSLMRWRPITALPRQ